MKNFVVIFIVLCIGLLNAQIDDRKQKANDFLNIIVAKEFTKVTDYYDDVMKEQFPPMKVKQFWNGVISQYGEALNFGQPTEHELSGFNAVYIPIYFESITLEARVVFNDKNLISGFFITPKNNSELYQLPEYADTTKFEEDNFTFGSDYWKMAGTLTIPKDVENPPVVVLVHGSGSHDRDESIGPNKPFKDIAWGLASQGIAVFRYDKRNYMHPDKFLENLDTITMYSESIEDPIIAVNALKELNNFSNSKFYLLGHSQGGYVIPYINSISSDYDGYISIAGLASDFRETLKRQYEYLFNFDGNFDVSEKQIYNELLSKIKKLDSLDSKNYDNKSLPLDLSQAYWSFILEYDIQTKIRDITKPILVINGEKDYQVVEEDFLIWKKNLNNNKNAEFKWYDNLNHLLMLTENEKSGPRDYYIPANINNQVIIDIIKWIKSKD
jgi:pimeloyl-ACP methyl ester carboxylesterase